jgi:hypothetical protein
LPGLLDPAAPHSCGGGLGAAGLHVGQLSPQQEVKFAPLLETGNIYRSLIPFLKDQEKLTAYVEGSCATKIMDYPANLLYANFLPSTQQSGDLPPENQNVKVCADTFNAFETHVTYESASLDCSVGSVDVHDYFQTYNEYGTATLMANVWHAH